MTEQNKTSTVKEIKKNQETKKEKTDRENSVGRVRLGGQSGNGECDVLRKGLWPLGSELRQNVPVSGGRQTYRL